MKHFMTFLASLILLGVAVTAAQAEISLSFDYTPNAAQASDGTWLDKYVFTVDGGGENVSAVEAGKAGNWSGTIITAAGFSGEIYNQWPSYDPPGPVSVKHEPTPLSTYDHNGVETASPAVDSHWLVTPNAVLYRPEENVGSVIGVPVAVDGALDDCWSPSLVMTAGFANQAPVMDLAQIYVRAGSQPFWDFIVATDSGSAERFNGTTPIGGFPALSCDSTLDFEFVRVGTTGTETLTVTSIAGYDATLLGTFPAASGEFGPGNTSTFSIGYLNSDIRQYTYTPIARGPDSLVITVISATGDADVTLSGTGVGPVFDSSTSPDSTLDFEEVLYGTPESFYLDISNITTDDNGGDTTLTDLTLLDFSITGDEADLFEMVGFTPGMVLHKDDNCCIELRYNGTGALGTANATLTLFTDEGAALGGDGLDYSYNIMAIVVPEPSTISLLLFGLASLLCYRRRR
ncbi:MAG: PEP-CTERM sorting domain-containing protein [Pirellulales bacterium]|nr:PEP-CTERM sorting domain-containing protein [Pirellulales bacterium]